MSAWAPWSAEAFARARAQGKPVLATVGPLPHATLRAAEGEIARRFVAVVADPRARPDAAARIGPNHAVVLGADGGRRAVLPLPAVDLTAALDRLATEAVAYDAGRPEGPSGPVWTGAVREKPLVAPPAAEAVAAAFAALPGIAAPDAEVLDALAHAATERGDAAARAALLRALDAAPVAKDADLSVQARRVHLLWHAFSLTADEARREAAALATEALLSSLHEPAVGAFRQSPGSDVYPADGNAQAVLAMLRAAAFGARDAAGAADRALTFLQTRLYDPLLGLVHSQSGGGESVHGLLGDAAWTALASTEAFLAGGVKQHREFADGLLRFLFQELWDRDGGGFLDRVHRPDDPAILREPRVDPALNAVALQVCWRLHHLKGNANYRRWLDWGLRGAWPATGEPEARAALARAADMAARGRADFELIGRPGDPKAAALLTALRRRCLPRAIVSFVDPDDQDYILAHKLTAESYPRLFGCGRDLRRLADAGSPDAVDAVVAAVRDAEAA